MPRYSNQGVLLRHVRTKAGLTRMQIAQKLGLTTPTRNHYIGTIERGQSCLSPARWRKLHKLVDKASVKEAYMKDHEHIFNLKYGRPRW